MARGDNPHVPAMQVGSVRVSGREKGGSHYLDCAGYSFTRQTISPWVIEGEKPEGKKKFQRAKKIKRADKETAPITLNAQQSAAPPMPPLSSLSVSDEPEPNMSRGITYKRFCRSLIRLSPRT